MGRLAGGRDPGQIEGYEHRSFTFDPEEVFLVQSAREESLGL